jgi:hypothetical protein
MGNENPIMTCAINNSLISEAKYNVALLTTPEIKPRMIMGFLPNLSDNVPDGSVMPMDINILIAVKIPMVALEALKSIEAYIVRREPPIFIPREKRNPMINICTNPFSNNFMSLTLFFLKL